MRVTVRDPSRKVKHLNDVVEIKKIITGITMSVGSNRIC